MGSTAIQRKWCESFVRSAASEMAGDSEANMTVWRRCAST